MLDNRKRFARVYLRYENVVISRCKACGFRGEELRQLVQEVFLTIWNKFETWPTDLRNEAAYVGSFATNIAQSAQRKLLAKKRRKLEKRDELLPQVVQPTTEQPDEAFQAIQCELLERDELRAAFRVLLAALSPEHREVIATRLVDDEASLTQLFGKGEAQEAIRALRRLIDLPVEGPARAGVRDVIDHILRAAEAQAKRPAVQAALNAPQMAGAIHEVMSCESDSSNAHDDPTNAPSPAPKRAIATFPRRAFRLRRTSGATASTATSTSAAATQPSRSQRPSSGIVHSPRPAPSAPTGGGSATSASAPRSELLDGLSSPSAAMSATTTASMSSPTKTSSSTSATDEITLPDDEPSFSESDR